MKILTSIFLASTVLLAAGAPANTCGIEREGAFIRIPGETRFLLTCWPVEVTAATVVRDAQGQSITLAGIPEHATVTATGCLTPDEFTLVADTVTYQSPDPALLVSDVQIILGRNEGGLFVQHLSDKTLGPEGPESLSPALTLEIGKRYLFSYPHTDDPLSIGAVSAGSGGWSEPLLIQGAPFGEYELDRVGIDWVDNGTDVYFTLTQQLADAMEGNDLQEPGFCLTFQQQFSGRIVFNGKSNVQDWTMY